MCVWTNIFTEKKREKNVIMVLQKFLILKASLSKQTRYEQAMSHVTRKPFFVVCNQVSLNPAS